MKEKEFLVIKGKKGQLLNQREANAISDGTVNGLLLFDVEKKRYKATLTYNVDGLISYSDFLRINNINKRLFVVLLRNLILILKEVEDNHFSKNLLMWNLQTTYVDPSTWHVYMMYVPLQPFESTGNLKSFILETISNCNFETGENIEYVQSLVRELNSVTAYTVGMLEAYCDRVSDELLKQKRNGDCQEVCTACGSKLATEETICPFCGKRTLTQVRTCLRDEENQVGIDASKTSRGSISISEDQNGVVTVFRGAQHVVQSVWLENCSQIGKIHISKFPFRIGKMEGVTDHRIFNNAVSRKHADILKDQGKYYIVDLGSTNGTYLNNKRIQPGVKELLTDGMVIKFANSQYKIHID